MVRQQNATFYTTPWNHLLTFRDTSVENVYWTRRVKTLLRFCDRTGSLVAIAVGILLFSKVELSNRYCRLLGGANIMFAVILLGFTFASDEIFLKWRPQVVLWFKVLVLYTSGNLKLWIPSQENSMSYPLLPFLFQCNSVLLVMTALGTMSRFRTHIVIQPVLVVMATHFCQLYCAVPIWARNVNTMIEDMGLKIEDTIWMLMTLEHSPSGMVHVSRESACWFTTSFINWTVSLLACALLYVMESHSRVAFLLAYKPHSVQYRELLWKSWRHTVLISSWCVVIGLAMVYAVFKMVV